MESRCPVIPSPDPKASAQTALDRWLDGHLTWCRLGLDQDEECACGYEAARAELSGLRADLDEAVRMVRLAYPHVRRDCPTGRTLSAFLATKRPQ